MGKAFRNGGKGGIYNMSESMASIADVVNTFPKSGIEDLASDASFSEKLLYSLKFAAVGMITVFLVLIILMGVLYAFKLYHNISSKNGVSAPASLEKAPVSPEKAPSVSSDSEEVIVALASAAIAAYRGKSDCAFKVISVTKIQ